MYKHYKTTVKRPGELGVLAVYPLIGVISLGIFAYFITIKGSPPETMPFILLGVIVWEIYNVSQRYGSWSLFLDIWNGSLKHSFAGSSSFWGFVLGNSLFGLFASIVIFMLMSLVGFFAFGFNMLIVGFFLINFIPVYLFGTSFGLFVGSLILTKGEKYMSMIWLTPGIIMIFSGIYYPIELLPGPIQLISNAIPTTHAIISLRGVAGFGTASAFQSFILALISSLIYLSVSLLTFNWAIKKGKESGRIANL